MPIIEDRSSSVSKFQRDGRSLNEGEMLRAQMCHRERRRDIRIAENQRLNAIDDGLLAGADL